jgi:hypothetical protein
MSTPEMNEVRCIGKALLKLFELVRVDLRERDREKLSKLDSISVTSHYILSGGHVPKFERTFNIRTQKKHIMVKLDGFQKKLKKIGVLDSGYTSKLNYSGCLCKLHQFLFFRGADRQKHYSDNIQKYWFIDYTTCILDNGVPFISEFIGSVSPDYVYWDKCHVGHLLVKMRYRTPLWLTALFQPSVVETSL